MGSNQSKQLHPKRVASPSSSSSSSSPAATRANAKQQQQQQQTTTTTTPALVQQPPPEAAAEPPSASLSGCTTRHGTADPTMSSNYNDTTTRRSRRPIDSGYSGSRWSSTLFSHAPHTTSSTISTVSTLSWVCVQHDDSTAPDAVAAAVADQPPPYYCYPHPEVDEDQLNSDTLALSTDAILHLLHRKPHHAYRILDLAFSKARLLDDPADYAAAFQAALRWSQRQTDDDDDNSNDVAQVWVARCYLDGLGTTRNPVAAVSQLKQLVDRGCWRAFYPLAMCYLEGVRAPNDHVVQPVDKEIAYQWFSTAAQLDPAQLQDALPIIALAQFRIATLLTEEDPKAALQWFLKSASHGNLHAQYIVGVHYEFGIHTDKDVDKAKEYMLKSAMQDFAHAQAALGILLINAHQYEEGIHWLEQAAAVDNPRALFRLGLMYEEGIAVDQNNETAAIYFKAAANRGNAAAQFQLAIKYSFGGIGLQPNLQEADRYLRMSANAGYSRAQRHLGLMYLEQGPHNQHRHNKNNRFAVEWFFRAAAQGDVMAYILLGECYEHGRGVETNHATALEYYTKAADIASEHQGKAQLATAELMLKHRRTADAFDWFVRASENAECLHQLRSCSKCRAKLMVARYYLHGWGHVDCDQERAYRMLTELADANQSDYYAHYWLATCYLEGIANVCEINYKTAYRHYRLAAEMGYVEAEFQVGLMLSNGTGTPCNREEAFEWYTKAAEKDYHPAYYNLGLWHHTTVPKDLAKATECFEKAAYLGNASAMEALGTIYLKESSAPVPLLDRHHIRQQQQRRKQAIQWFKKAADLGNRTAQRELGKLYGTGQGIARNYERAFGLFGQAAAQNDPEATLLLGSYYEQGHAVEKDPEHALRLYLKAGRLGSAVASFAAGQLCHLLNRHQEAYAQYRIAAEDSRLTGEMVGKSATLMLARYILSYIPAMDNDGTLGNVTREQAFSMLERLSTMDEFVPAFYWLGDCFHHGRGTQVDLAQALMWFQRAVDEANDVDAVVQLASMYDKGIGVAEDKRRAFELYKQAAEHNHAEGQYQLGLAHWHGLHDIVVNKIEATRWFTLSAAQGFGSSHWAMGQMAFEIGDHNLAREHWENGRRLEHALSIRSLAQLLLTTQANDTERAQQSMKATELLTEAVILGDLDALAALGRVHHTNATICAHQFASLMAEATSKNEDDDENDASALLLQRQQESLESATQCFEQAAMAGHVESMFLAGQIWHEQKQYAAAHEYYDQAANQGHLLSRVMRARYRLAGGLGGVEANPEAGYQELMECAQMEEGMEAYHSIGQCYELGLGVEQNYQSAFEWYVRSAESTGDAEALVCIGRLFANRLIQHPQQHGDMEAMQWFRLACAYDNHSKAHYQLGMYYLHGIQDNGKILLSASRYTALQHFEQAARQQDRDAMFQLANLFLDLDASDAIQWMDRSAQLGSPDALRELGKLYYMGHVVDQDFERAFDLFLRAAQLNDTDAAMLAGKFYEHGITAAPDLDQARYWYELAIQSGHGWAAELALALLLHRSEQSQHEAYLLFRSALTHSFTAEQRTTPDIMVALYHLHGWGGAVVEEEPAMVTLLAYARAGHTRVYYQVAQCYEAGLGVQRDLAEALRWYSLLEPLATSIEDVDEELDQDITNALLRLAEFYRHGWKTMKSQERADRLSQLASERTL